MSEYKVVVKEVTSVIWRDVDKAAQELARDVSADLASGWEVQGGIASIQAGTGVYLIQALQRRRVLIVPRRADDPQALRARRTRNQVGCCNHAYPAGLVSCTRCSLYHPSLRAGRSATAPEGLDCAGLHNRVSHVAAFWLRITALDLI